MTASLVLCPLRSCKGGVPLRVVLEDDPTEPLPASFFFGEERDDFVGEEEDFVGLGTPVVDNGRAAEADLTGLVGMLLLPAVDVELLVVGTALRRASARGGIDGVVADAVDVFGSAAASAAAAFEEEKSLTSVPCTLRAEPNGSTAAGAAAVPPTEPFSLANTRSVHRVGLTPGSGFPITWLSAAIH